MLFQTIFAPSEDFHNCAKFFSLTSDVTRSTSRCQSSLVVETPRSKQPLSANVAISYTVRWFCPSNTVSAPCHARRGCQPTSAMPLAQHQFVLPPRSTYEKISVFHHPWPTIAKFLQVLAKCGHFKPPVTLSSPPTLKALLTIIIASKKVLQAPKGWTSTRKNRHVSLV